MEDKVLVREYLLIEGIIIMIYSTVEIILLLDTTVLGS